MYYRPSLNSLWSAGACFGDCIALLLSLFWEPLGLLWVTLGSLEAHFGTPGDALGRLGGILGQHWRFGVHRRPLRQPKALKYRACAQKQASWNLRAGPDGPDGPADPAGPGETAHELQFRTYLQHAPGIRMT